MPEKMRFRGLWGIPLLVMTEASVALTKKEKPLTMELAKQVSQGEHCKALLIEVRRVPYEQSLPLVALVKDRPEGLSYIAWFITHADRGHHRTIILHDTLTLSSHPKILTELMTCYTRDCLRIDPGAFSDQWLEEMMPVTRWLEEQELYPEPLEDKTEKQFF